LVRLETIGLKRSDRVINLGPVTVVLGENGAGKSSMVRDALHLLAFGRAPDDRIPKTHDGVMLLARDSEIDLRAELERDGAKIGIRRRWRRKTSGQVEETVETTGLPRVEGGHRERAGQVAGLLGGVLEAWRPDEILSLKPQTLRTKLLSILPADGFRLQDWVPDGCPQYAEPSGPGESVLDWAIAAASRTRGRLLELHEERRKDEAIVSETEGDWAGGDPAVPQARLEELRRAWLQTEQRFQAEGRLIHLRERLAEIRGLAASVGEDLEVRRLAAGVVLAAAAAVEQKRLALLQEESTQKLLVRRAEEACGPPLPSPRPTRAGLGVELKAARGRSAEIAAAKETAALIAGARSIVVPSCPQCGADLRSAHADTVRAASDAVAALAKDHALAERETTRILSMDGRVADVERAEAQAAGAGLALAEAQAALAALPTAADTRTAAAQADESYRAIEAGSRAGRESAGLEVEILGLEAELDEEAPTMTRDEIGTAIRVAEAELEEVGAKQERARMLVEAREHIRWLEPRIEEARAWEGKFRDIQTRLLATVAGVFEARLSAAGAGLKVILFDERANPTARLELDGVPVMTLSAGERLRLGAALAQAFAAAQPGEFRPVLLDGLESISAGNRGPFLSALTAAVSSGAIDQAIIAGCPDSIPDVPGVTVIDLGVE